MKVSLNWLKDYVELPEDLSIEDLAYDLTMRTVEVEDVESLRDRFSGIVVGEILSIEKHENADTLWVCKVNVGGERDLQIVCGGQNLFVGQKVAVSVPGAMVRWHGQGEAVEIKSTKLRGVLSEGMICGANELDLEVLFPAAEHDIMDLSDLEKAQPGVNIADAIGLDDYIIEIDNKSMTHRPDLWGHYGIARELAAIYSTKLKDLETFKFADDLDNYPVEISTKNCNAYSAYVIDKVKVEKSPLDMRIRLWSVDVNPKNNLVDITNYVMLTTGQPTHGFDYKHVESGILVRDANSGEKLELLDGTILDLDPEDVIISDGKKPLALGGVMGGKQDSILADTNSMLLEIASFSPLAVRRTSKRHNVRTDSSSRYEKNIDTARMEDAKNLAFNLLNKLLPEAKVIAKGQAKQHETERNEITVKYDYLNVRIGREITSQEIHLSLEPLGFEIIHENESEFTVLAPVWRSTGDIQMPADILEEIARMIGYENFSLIAPSIKLEAAVNQREVNLNHNLHKYFAIRCGFQEVYTYPWVDSHYIEAAGIDAGEWLELQDAPSPTQSKLRGSLVPGLLEAAVKNLRYKSEFKIFEQAQVFAKGYSTPSSPEEVLPEQKNYLGLLAAGDSPELLFRDVKGSLELMARYNHCSGITFAQEEKPTWADPKVWLNILDKDGEIIGDLGMISPKTAKNSGVKNHYVVIAEFDLDHIESLDSRTNSYESLNQYQVVTQDLNIWVKDEVKWSEIAELVEPLVQGLEFLEIYRSAEMAKDEKSILLRYELSAPDHTLSSDEIEAKNAEILEILVKNLGAKQN